MRNLSPQEVAELLAGPDEPPLLLDVREPWELAICRLPGSLSLPMAQVPRGLGSLPRDREILVVCHHGIRSLQVARYLEQQGFPRVGNLAGGLAAWARDLDPTLPTY
jgi:rhodanese-related sulfurtransferase